MIIRSGGGKCAKRRLKYLIIPAERIGCRNKYPADGGRVAVQVIPHPHSRLRTFDDQQVAVVPDGLKGREPLVRLRFILQAVIGAGYRCVAIGYSGLEHRLGHTFEPFVGELLPEIAGLYLHMRDLFLEHAVGQGDDAVDGLAPIRYFIAAPQRRRPLKFHPMKEVADI